MLFQHVAIAGLAHIDAPRRLTSDEINARLKPTLDRLGIKYQRAGGQSPASTSAACGTARSRASDAATLAGVKALADAGIDADRVGLLVNTSVSRDYLEPSTASIVSGNLRLPDTCQNFDVANACLAFLNGMDIASRMIERGEIDYALVVDGETADLAYEKTLERLQPRRRHRRAVPRRDGHADARLRRRRDGAGAQPNWCPGAPRYRGSVTRSATEWNQLCRGNLHDRMVTDGRMLMIEGLKLGAEDLRRRQAPRWAGWSRNSTSSSSTRSARPTPRPSSRPSASTRRRS